MGHGWGMVTNLMSFVRKRGFDDYIEKGSLLSGVMVALLVLDVGSIFWKHISEHIELMKVEIYLRLCPLLDHIMSWLDLILDM